MHDVALADGTVRRARAHDAAIIAQVQLAAWTSDFPATLTARVRHIEQPEIEASWSAAITSPPSNQHIVLVALARGQVVGFAATSPVEIVALEVHPDWRGSGHGSRLLNAAVDQIRAAGATSVGMWLLADDQARAGFVSRAGLAPDGRQRRLFDTEGHDEVVEVRYAAHL